MPGMKSSASSELLQCTGWLFADDCGRDGRLASDTGEVEGGRTGDVEGDHLQKTHHVRTSNARGIRRRERATWRASEKKVILGCKT